MIARIKATYRAWRLFRDYSPTMREADDQPAWTEADRMALAAFLHSPAGKKLALRLRVSHAMAQHRAATESGDPRIPAGFWLMMTSLIAHSKLAEAPAEDWQDDDFQRPTPLDEELGE